MNNITNPHPIGILLVEDNPGDVRLTKEAFQEGDLDFQLHVVEDGVEALAFLRQEGEYADKPRPDLILLDLNLPRMDGREAIKAFWQGAIDMGLTDITIEPVEVDILGNVATDVGTISARLGDAELTGKYIVIGKNGADGWLIHRDTWNFDA